MKIAGRVTTIIAATAAAFSLAFAGSASAAPDWERAPIPGKSDAKAAAEPGDPFWWILSPKHLDKQQCLDLQGGGEANGAPIIQWTCHFLDNQWFAPLRTFDASGNVSIVFINKKSGKCIDLNGSGLANGTPIIQWTCHNGANQQWELVLVENDPNTPNDDTFLMKNRKSGKCVDLGSTVAGTNAVQWDCHGAAHQQFTPYVLADD